MSKIKILTSLEEITNGYPIIHQSGEQPYCIFPCNIQGEELFKLLGIDDFGTENITMIGNNKEWKNE